MRLDAKLSLGDVVNAMAQLPDDERFSVPQLSAVELGHIRKPGRGRLWSLATVLGLKPELVLELAGLDVRATRDETDTISPTAHQVALRVSQLTPAQQQIVLKLLDSIQTTGD